MPSPTDPILIFIQSTISFLLLIITTSTASTNAAARQCPSSYTACGQTVDVHFPFSVINQSQPDHQILTNCTYPGFNLSCTLLNLPTLHLPYAGNFTIQSINYIDQHLYISDPNNCFPSRLPHFNLSSSPFRSVAQLQNFVFFSCPAEKVPLAFWTLKCLSNESWTVIGLREGNEEKNAPEGCVEMERVRVPSGWVGYEFDDGFNGGVWLEWDSPDCRACAAVDGLCGYRGSAELEVGCLDVPTNDGLSKTVNYPLVIGILCVICIIVLLCCCTCCKKNFSTSHHQTSLEFSTAIAPQPHNPTGRGLNQQPTMLGQTKRSPKPSSEDGTCAICLGDYRAKEALRTLPECRHIFHARCVDAWLELNATCPVCRADTPDRSSTSSTSKSTRHLLS